MGGVPALILVFLESMQTIKPFSAGLLVILAFSVCGCPASDVSAGEENNQQSGFPAAYVQDDTGIIAVGNLSVHQIEGPDIIKWDETERYSVEASGCGDVSYKWYCEPPEAGEFGDPDSSQSDFHAGDNQTESTQLITIKVEVGSSSCGAVIRSLVVLIVSTPDT